MKRLLRPLLLCLAMLALPVQGIAGTVMTICSAAPATGVAAMMSRHAAIKSQVEAEWRQQGGHGQCHENGAPASDAASDAASTDDEPALDSSHAAAADDNHNNGGHDGGQTHQHASAGCVACATCALGAALPVGPLDLALSHYRHTLPRSASATMADIRLDTLLRPPSDRC